MDPLHTAVGHVVEEALVALARLPALMISGSLPKVMCLRDGRG
jgi:hypothetical protein